MDDDVMEDDPLLPTEPSQGSRKIGVRQGVVLLLTIFSVLTITAAVLFLLPTQDSRHRANAFWKHSMEAAPDLLSDYQAWPPTCEFLDQFKDDEGRLTIVGVNWGYLDMFYLWWKRAAQVGVQNYVVVAYDQRMFAQLRPTRRVLFPFHNEAPPNQSTAAFDYLSDEFRRLTQTRPGVLQAVLDLGYTVFYSDTDTAFRRNPYPVFDAVLAQDADLDVIASEDGCEGYWCSCLLYLRARPRTMQLMEEWSRQCADLPQDEDQVALNAARPHVPDLRYHLVPKWVFPDGALMFEHGYDWVTHPEGPVIVHANWMIGHDTKIRALLNEAVWNK